MRMSDPNLESALAPDSEAMATAWTNFQRAYPSYQTTRRLDDLRAQEYGRLDEQQHIYLDYTGGGLYADSQLREHLALLRHRVLGNPHSNNPTSRAMTNLVEGARAYVLKYFNASPQDYTAIFTSNASGALRLVGEAYPFAPDGRYLLTFDNHNSVNGIREFARAKGAAVDYAPLTSPDLRIAQAQQGPEYFGVMSAQCRSRPARLTWRLTELRYHGRHRQRFAV